MQEQKRTCFQEKEVYCFYYYLVGWIFTGKLPYRSMGGSENLSLCFRDAL